MNRHKKKNSGHKLLANDLISLKQNNSQIIIGIDEVGRGCLAGPIVGCAISFSKKQLEEMMSDKISVMIFDSKKLSGKKRTELSAYIQQHALSCIISQKTSKYIDKHGIQKANYTVMLDAYKKTYLKIDTSNHFNILTITDHLNIKKQLSLSGLQNNTFLNPSKADAVFFSVACASIVAKTYRDNLLKTKIHKRYPQYGFDTHVGYGTKEHLLAIQKYGYTPLHRKSFRLKADRV